MKGDISREFTVWCSDCVEWHQVSAPNMKEAIALFEMAKWKKIPKTGWMCPECFVKGL